MNEIEIQEISRKKSLNMDQQDLLSRKICDLPLSIKGSRLETLTAQLYQELEQKGITFKPGTYLADEWGCPQGVPVIGIPFYLADRELSNLEGRLTGIDAEDEKEVMMALRHEAGHAFNYAYHLYAKDEWRRLFGKFSLPYREDYKPIPFSARHVKHLPGWYAQKHPDEDFAETFAVWLTPDSDWRKQYAGTPALAKLMYVDQAAAEYGRQTPEVDNEKLDAPFQELTMTLGKWYQSGRAISRLDLNLLSTLDQDLKKLFPADQGQPAAEILTLKRNHIIQQVNLWTGMNRKLLTELIDKLFERVKALDLKIEPDQSAVQMINIAIFVTTLAMNYLYRGRFIEF